MQEHGTLTGEGFAIAAVQCALIEFLESTEQGINFSYGQGPKCLVLRSFGPG